jgi:hypothetical protein
MPGALCLCRKGAGLIRVITSLDGLVVAVVNGTAQGRPRDLLATDLQIAPA